MKGISRRSVMSRQAEGLKSDGVRRAAGTKRAKAAIRESTQAMLKVVSSRNRQEGDGRIVKAKVAAKPAEFVI